MLATSFVESIVVSMISTTIIFFGFADPLPFIPVDYFAQVARRQPLISLVGQARSNWSDWSGHGLTTFQTKLPQARLITSLLLGFRGHDN